MLDKLKGYKTYLVMLIGIVLNGLAAQGYIDASTIDLANKILVFLGLGAVRNGMK